jgi:hypothetical protein
MFTNLDFIHTRICYGFLNENNHQEYSVLLVVLSTTFAEKEKGARTNTRSFTEVPGGSAQCTAASIAYYCAG